MQSFSDIKRKKIYSHPTAEIVEFENGELLKDLPLGSESDDIQADAKRSSFSSNEDWFDTSEEESSSEVSGW